MDRVKRSREDLEQELTNQVEVLHSTCGLYDAGIASAAKQTSAIARTLLHDTKHLKSLLGQLGLKKNDFFDSSKPLPDVLFNGYCGLVTLQIDKQGSALRYAPRMDQVNGRWTAFHKWWDAPVIIHTYRHRFSRGDLIINVADTDGGVHVDPGFEPNYMEISRRNSLGWMAVYDGVPVQ